MKNMKKNKYHNQNKLLLMKIYFLFFVLFIILNIIIPNIIFAIIFGVLGIFFGGLCILTYAVTGGIAILGVPNNRFKDFGGLQNIFFEKELNFEEIEKGIWNCNIFGKMFVFDMKKWHKQTKKIHAILFFMIYVKEYNEKKIDHRGIFKKIKINEHESCIINFKKNNKKIKTNNLIKNGVLKRNFLIQLKLLQSIPTRGRGLDWKYLFKYKKQDISQFYIFNK